MFFIYNFLIHNSYSDYFTGTYTSYIGYNSIKITGLTHFWVYLSKFYSLSNHAIYIYTSGTTRAHLVVEICLFHNCYSTYRGGAIYYAVDNGGSVLNKVCGTNCYSTEATYWGQFSRICTINDNKNYCFLSTFAYNFGFSGSRIGSLIFWGGIQQIYNINSSYHYLSRISGFSSYLPYSLDFKYCTIVNNHVLSDTCMQIDGGTNLHYISYSNFGNNSQTSTSNGILSILTKKTYLSYCSFYLNSIYLFHCSSSNLLEISSCNIDISNFRTSGALVLSTIITYSIYPQTYLSNLFCMNLIFTKIIKINLLPKILIFHFQF